MPKRKLPPNEIIIAEYQSGKSSGEIAEKYGVSPITVIGLLRRLNVPRRSTEEAAQIRHKSGRAKTPHYWTGKKQPAAMVEKRVSKIRGENHWLWKGGKDRRLYRDKIEKIKCASCGSKINLGVHHIDYDHYNDSPDNLQILCCSCHLSLHKTEYWKAKRQNKKPRRSNGPVGWNRQKQS